MNSYLSARSDAPNGAAGSASDVAGEEGEIPQLRSCRTVERIDHLVDRGGLHRIHVGNEVFDDLAVDGGEYDLVAGFKVSYRPEMASVVMSSDHEVVREIVARVSARGVLQSVVVPVVVDGKVKALRRYRDYPDIRASVDSRARHFLQLDGNAALIRRIDGGRLLRSAAFLVRVGRDLFAG